MFITSEITTTHNTSDKNICVMSRCHVPIYDFFEYTPERLARQQDDMLAINHKYIHTHKMSNLSIKDQYFTCSYNKGQREYDIVEGFDLRFFTQLEDIQ